jgi:hypothetical protein
MPKLPSNLVKPPAFDNPLRRTGPVHAGGAATEAAPETTFRQLADDPSERAEGAVVIPITAPRADDHQDLAAAAVTPHRITVRIDDATRCALESECYRRRIAGEKTNIAEIARGLLSQWAAGHA